MPIKGVKFQNFCLLKIQLDTDFLTEIPYILESKLHPFYSFRGLRNQMRIRFAVESWILEK